MVDLTLLKFINIVGGVRYERIKTEYSAYGINDIGQGIVQSKALRNSLRNDKYLLPMENINFKPLKWMDMRVANTQSISQLSYFNFMPRYCSDYYRTLSGIGNPDLQPTLPHNFDVYL